MGSWTGGARGWAGGHTSNSIAQYLLPPSPACPLFLLQTLAAFQTKTTLVTIVTFQLHQKTSPQAKRLKPSLLARYQGMPPVWKAISVGNDQITPC